MNNQRWTEQNIDSDLAAALEAVNRSFAPMYAAEVRERFTTAAAEAVSRKLLREVDGVFSADMVDLTLAG